MHANEIVKWNLWEYIFSFRILVPFSFCVKYSDYEN